MVSCGSSHTVTVTNTGQVFTWGKGSDGQLGLGDLNSQWAPCQVKFGGSTRVISAECGVSHTVCLTDTGSLFSFGSNEYGQLGLSCSKGGPDFSYPQPINIS